MRKRTQITVIRLRKILLIGVLPPVDALTLLLPYPPKAGRAKKHPPTMFATPRATSSRLALRDMPCSPCLPPVPKLLAATEDSKNPSSAIRNEVPMASWICIILEGCNGHRNGNGEPVLDWMVPRISRPCLSQPNLHVKIAARTTTTKRSGT